MSEKKDTNNQDFGKLLNAKALGTLLSHLALGARGFFVPIENFLLGEMFHALTQLHRATSRWNRQTQIPEGVERYGDVVTGSASQRRSQLSHENIDYHAILASQITSPTFRCFLAVPVQKSLSSTFDRPNVAKITNQLRNTFMKYLKIVKNSFIFSITGIPVYKKNSCE